uniref:Peptidase M14 domain-containing protein n=1 Tax=Callorhinchus milii TaxID=7868 RepID=A0A4W3J8N0_CALMI
MKPLVYSEKDAKERGIGWFRSGHHITYKPLNKKSFYNLLPSTDNKNDSYYLAHCYPYSYTDLKAHLDEITNDQNHLEYFRKEVLCETRAGNSCFLLTITDSTTDKENVEGKLGVVLTARVHPGETQSSWMMKGIVDFLISEERIAKELRQRCVFKIVPMLNPDGVIFPYSTRLIIIPPKPKTIINWSFSIYDCLWDIAVRNWLPRSPTNIQSIHFTVCSVKRFGTSSRREKRYIKCKDYYYQRQTDRVGLRGLCGTKPHSGDTHVPSLTQT